MKKILATLLMAFALTAQAKETITIIYGFSAADNVANYSRILADEANKLQDRYTFIFDVRPGAGQVVAVNHVKSTPDTIFMTSGAFWVRPNFYPNESYNVNDFKTIMTQCSTPFSVASVKYKSWNDIPKDKELTIATSGLGVVSHLTATQIRTRFPKLTVVPFKSTTDAILAVAGGQVDLGVGFLGDLERWTSESSRVKLTILGVTGPTPIGPYANLSSQGFPAVFSKMNTTHNLMIPTSWSKEKSHEIREILVKAEQSRTVRNAYKLDYCDPLQIPENKLQSWFDEQNALWSGLTVGVKIE